jgi:hypothetical protein
MNQWHSSPSLEVISVDEQSTKAKPKK